MALEHAILVSLREQPGSGYELARRFDRSIGFFWSATHQQIYRVLARMEDDGWVGATSVPQHGRPEKKVYEVAPEGRRVLAEWLSTPAPTDKLRSEIAVKLRGASYGERLDVLDNLRDHLSEHQTRLAHYQQMATTDFPDADRLDGHRLDVYLVLRGGIRYEEFWVGWCAEVLETLGDPA